MIKVSDFEKSVYKFIKENYTDVHDYSFFYGRIVTDTNVDDIWLYCNFSELNVETGHFSLAYIDVATRVFSVDEYNTQLSVIIDDLRELFVSADIDLFDFMLPESPQKIVDNKIIVMDSGKQIYERLSELTSNEIKSLIQSSQMTFKAKLLKSFARCRVV